MVFNVAVSIGVGFAFSSLPALINAAVPMSETAAANGINSLARSLGTSMSSAVMGAVLAGMTMSFAGHEVPTLRAFHVALADRGRGRGGGRGAGVADPGTRPPQFEVREPSPPVA